MTRYVLAGIALLGLAGCAHERAAQRTAQAGPGAVGLPPEGPSIARTINGGLPPPDPATVRATSGVAVNRGPARGRAVATIAQGDATTPAPGVANAPAAGLAPTVPGPAAGTPFVGRDDPSPAMGPAVGASIPLVGAAAGDTQASAPVATMDAAQAPVATGSPVMPTAAGAGTPLPADAVASSPPSPVVDPAQPTVPTTPPGDAAGVNSALTAGANPAPVPVAETTDAGPSPAAASPSPDSVATAPVMPDTLPAPAQGNSPASIPLEVVPGTQPADAATAASPPAPATDRVPVPASNPTMPPAGGEVPDAVSRIAAPPSQPATTPRDPLLGSNPDVMPNLDGAADARVAPAGGAAAAPATSAPPAALPSGASGPADVMPPLGPQAGALAPIETGPQPGQVPGAGAAGALAPVPASAPVPAASAPEPLAPVEALAPVPAAAPVPPASVPDPLLGANPPLMPDQAVGGAPAPSALPPASPAKGVPTPAASIDALPPIEVPPPTAPQTPVTAPPAAPPTVVPGSASNPPAPSAAREEPKSDANLVRTAADPSTVRSNVTLKPQSSSGTMTPVSVIAARVGDEVITRTELFSAVRERGRKQFPGERLKKNELEMLASATLADLVDRSIVLQEAKRRLKDPKKYQMVVTAADQEFNQSEVPALMRKYHVTEQRALKDALIADDSSLEQVRENFRGRFIAGGYLGQHLNSRLKVDLPEKLVYYNAHLNEYDRPAQITWREIMVEVKKSPSRAEAHRRAESILARLRRGESFATVAQSDSDGPNRKLGGFWQTRPGGYGVTSVNNVLESAPVGQISPIIEGPTSLHIVVVEQRRDPGPARFDEVQDEVERAVYDEKYQKLTDEFLDGLRSHTYVWTMFDNTANDPKVVRANHTKRRAPSR